MEKTPSNEPMGKAPELKAISSQEQPTSSTGETGVMQAAQAEAISWQVIAFVFWCLSPRLQREIARIRSSAYPRRFILTPETPACWDTGA